MSRIVRCLLGGAIAVLVTVVPFVFYRWEYTHNKRLREVVPGRIYRSGQMTAGGFAEAVERLHIRAVLNLQDEYPDPEISEGYFTGASVAESELCRRLGVRYLYLAPDLLPHRQAVTHHPVAIDKLREILADPGNLPLLIHCRAGLHRTGVLVGVYRMSYQSWSPGEAIREMKANGFGIWPCTSANEYIAQYILKYHPEAAAESMAPVRPRFEAAVPPDQAGRRQVP
jgi:hypothetical protein